MLMFTDLDEVMGSLKQHYEDCSRQFNVLKYVSKSPRVEVQRTYVKLLLMNGGNELVAGARYDQMIYRLDYRVKTSFQNCNVFLC